MSCVVPVAGDLTDWISFQVALVALSPFPSGVVPVTTTLSAPSLVALPPYPDPVRSTIPS